MKNGDKTVLDMDEYIYIRESLAKKPTMFSRAPVLFQNSMYHFSQFYKDYGNFIGNKNYEEGLTLPTITLFNACPRSDAAAVIIVTTDTKAKQLGLKVLAKIKSWAFIGNNPAYMGIAPALATPIALNRAGITFDELHNIELHEAFAATVLSAFKVGKDNYGHNWKKKWEEEVLNPNGGSMPLGHPLAATGTRLILNLIFAMRDDPESRYGMAAACAGGGIGGAMIVEKMDI